MSNVPTVLDIQFVSREEISTMYRDTLAELEKKVLQTRVAYLISQRQLESLRKDYHEWQSSTSSPESEK